ncbi:hypothetical protein LZ554_007449 [Drepanopeziza brunnea f. sp. 'monogermtubi']|nr:hypothetical protein LZ554_007449 [Drepanopeziza brunnea f. sp. 'monogermtubi']
MAPTKNSARGGPDTGLAARAAATSKQSKQTKRAAKRKRGPDSSSSSSQPQQQQQQPPSHAAKRARRAAALVEEEEEEEDDATRDTAKSASKPAAAATDTSLDGASLPPLVFPGLLEEEAGYEVVTMSILSSGSIQKKVARCLEVLRYDDDDGGGKKKEKEKEKEKKKGRVVVMMYAKAAVVAKMISVAEIVKREVGRGGGKWWQYCVVGELLEARKSKGGESQGKGKGRKEERRDKGEDGDGEDDGEEEGFETMKTPFERALVGKEKVRAMPNMCLYLSRVRIEGLRKAYGEQTNAAEKKD